MEQNIVISETLKRRFFRSLRQGRCMFFSAPSGYGKTVSAWNLLEEAEAAYEYRSCRAGGQCLERMEGNTVVLLDDLQFLDEQNEQRLAEDIANREGRRIYILLSRAKLPAPLRPLLLQEKITAFSRKDLELGIGEIRVLQEQFQLEDGEYAKILWEKCGGYPLAVKLAIMESGKGSPFGIVEPVKNALFDYYDGRILSSWPEELRCFVLKLAAFNAFSPEMAAMVTGCHDAKQRLAQAAKLSGVFSPKSEGWWQIDPLYSQYLKEKRELLLTEEAIRTTFRNAGLYYELEGESHKALSCYHDSGDHHKMIELLEANARQHPGMGHYYEMEEHYRALPKDVVLQSPHLICAMSILSSMCMQEEESEYWYQCLRQLLGKLDKGGYAYNQAKSRLLYLDIALPHRGSWKIFHALLKAAAFTARTGMPLPEFCVTSNIPSILRGGKDFSRWTKVDRKLYKTARTPIERVLGKYGAGLGDIALGESLFEKGEEGSYELLLLLNRGLLRAESEGCEEICFAGKGLMARIYVSQGDLQAAAELLRVFYRTMEEKKNSRLLPNVRAMELRLSLLQGDSFADREWMETEAPDENARFYTMERYRYLLKIRCYIRQERFMEALSLLGHIKAYAARYDRTYDWIEAMALTAIVLFRMGNEEKWKKAAAAALESAGEFGFVRVLSEEGAAFLPLLERMELDFLAEPYRVRLMKAVRSQALFYPKYLQPPRRLEEPLTNMEQTVLRLMSQGMKNSQIAEFLFVSPNTIKFHIKNIYSKMHVKNRTQAVEEGKRYKLI